MTNKEKIVKLMKKYNVGKAIYSSGMNILAEMLFLLENWIRIL